MKKIGIEKINVYGASMCLDLSDLAVARNRDPEQIQRDFLIETRSLNPPWEDTITMSVNAADAMLSDTDKKDIGMLIVGTEGSLDFGKPISTNVHSALGLDTKVRNYETKFACYSGVAAIDTAVNWIASGLNRGKKALVIASDFSRQHIDNEGEFVMGGCASAALISEEPKIIQYHIDKKGTWTTDIYDTFRPSAHAEVGNNEVSLFSYMDAVQGSYDHYCELVGSPDFDKDFAYFVYHTPFPGIAFQAHRTLTRLHSPKPKSALREDFEKRVVPALAYSKRVGSTYGTSNLTGLAAVVNHGPDIEGKDIALFAYGSGAIGEFYSGRVLPGARSELQKQGIDEKLKMRRKCSVEEYELVERIRDRYVENSDFVPDFSILDGWYAEHYEGSGLYALKEVKNWYRRYERA